ncbi:MAG: glycosyltransferase family 2 protein [Bacilli bacterium]|nr:glycosyltransferase family 2 protein [Bacilli bacterium]MCI9585411.1 glycosyltransferase family 2 protein [Bacilli bacterium]
MKNDLISIIVPVYNAEKFISDTINSIKKQTYKNWELILVDDCSIDNSVRIIKEFIKNDNRIKLFQQNKNNGVATTRNKGIEVATGKYLCFIDADDLWNPDKLNKQVNFMKQNNCAFSFTGYEFTNKDGIPNGKKVFIPNQINYKQALKNTTIWTSTVMFDLTKLSKKDITMPNVKSEDTATWWKILKKTDYAYGLNEILSYYRRSPNTLSANKLTAIKRIWHLYRNIEHLNIFYSSYNFCFYAINALKRRI